MDTALIEAAGLAIEAGRVTQDGRPLVTAMETAMGRDVTAKERDAAYTAIMNKVTDSGRRAKPDSPPAWVATRWIYTGPNMRVNGVPVLRDTVFIGDLPAYLAGFEKQCKILGGIK